MITKLTKEQEAKIPEYVDKWLKVGLCTDRIDRQLAKRVADYYYSNIANNKPVPIVIMDSPYSAWLAVCLLSFESQVGSQVESQVGSQVRSQVGSQVGSQVRSQVESQVRSQVESQVGSQVRSQVGSQVESQVRSQVESQVENFVWSYLDGSFWASWFSFYDFMFHIGVSLSSATEIHYNWFKDTTQLGLIYPLEYACVICERPTAIRMKNGRLHSENSPSVEYADGFCVYSLNGVRMKPEHVLTPAEKLKPKDILAETNADMRRELIRKIGLVRLTEHGKVLDTWNNYKLIDMAPVLGLNYSPFLLMKNPSVADTWHLEGVPRECKTVEHALNARKPKALREIPVDDKGEDWYQQGDVCIWPEKALSLKRLPIVIT